MTRTAAVVVLLTLGTSTLSPGVATERVSLRVTPVVALEPALLTIRTTIEPSDENRLLSVSVVSADYSTSSEMTLAGRLGARLNVLEVRDVPMGEYEVRAVLVGVHGPIASTAKVVKIQPAPGRTR